MTGDAEDFAEMALRLHDEPTVVETVEAVLEYGLKAINCAYAGVMLVHGGKRVETIFCTDPIVTEVDKIQAACGQGPDIDALTDRYSLIVDDTETDQRWPKWSPLVTEAGIHSLLSVRLYTTADTIGTLNLYDPAPHHFEADDEAVAHILARHAAVALASARTEEHLWQAIDARKVIGTAQGILMERFDLSEDKAFAVLLRYSQDRNIKLRAVAERLIESGKLPT